MRYRVHHEVTAKVGPWRIFCYTAVVFLLGMATALIAAGIN